MHRSVATISRARVALSLLALVAVSAGVWLSPATNARAATTLTVTIHYFRYDGNYLTGQTPHWDVWAWNDSATDGDSGTQREFNGSDSFGKLTTFTQLCNSCTQIGFIVRLSDWSNREESTNGNGNRYIPVVAGTTNYSAWVVTGDKNTYYTLATAEAAKSLSLETAFLDSPSVVTASTNRQMTFGSGLSGFKVEDLTTKKSLPIKAVEDGYAQPGMTLAVAGTFQKKLKDTNWNPNSAITRMHAERGGSFYQFTTTLPAGNYEYKITTPNWGSSWPTANVGLDLPGKEQVTFYFYPNGDQVQDTINDGIITLPGDPGWKTDRIDVVLKSPPNVRNVMQVSAAKTAVSTKLAPLTVIPRNVLNGSEYYYSGELGAIYSAASTTFRLWAPDATAVKLQLFNSETGPVTKTVAMTPEPGGIVQATVNGDLSGWYYLYQVSVLGETNTAVDPYAENVAPNGTRAMVVNLPATNPAGWSSDQHVGVANQVDASIYEVDVRDFTINPNSGVSAPDRGTYLGFTQTGTTGPGGVTTGIDSLKDLGVKDVELMPTYRFATLDETQAPFAYPCPDVAANAPNPCYNWGYDPANYNTPEGAYATSVHGTTRITEFKQMVEAIHNAGMGVILDAVYNHVYDTSIFNNIVPDYYFRTDALGNYYNGSGQGNEVATEKPMVLKFAEDSMKYWIEQYHVDGFRMDEMFLFGKSELKKVASDLRAIDPGLVILGEPWGSSASGLPQSQQVTQGNQAGVGVGLFNGDFRDALCCNAFGASSLGFANGGGLNSGAVEEGIVGSIAYNGSISDWASQPSETINYATDHDNWTLWDRINQYSNASDTLQNKILEDELAQALVITSQGVPFIQGGEEFLRTKGTGPNNGNSYDGGDADNQFDWSLKNTNINVFNYYAGLFHLRNAHPAFRMTTAAQIKSNLTFLTSPADTVAYELNGAAVGDSWNNIIVMSNPTSSDQTLSLPSGTWTVVGDQGQVGTTSLGSASGSVQVTPLTTEILYK